MDKAERWLQGWTCEEQMDLLDLPDPIIEILSSEMGTDVPTGIGPDTPPEPLVVISPDP